MTVSLPVMLRVGGRRVLVVGGGAVGERSTLALLEAGARVAVVSPEVTLRLRDLAAAGEVEWREGRFVPGDTAGADLVFACTSDREVNAAVTAAARRQRAPVLAVDDPEGSDFTRMAAIQRGPLTLAVSTGEPPAPALAAAIRDRVAELVEPGAGAVVEAFALRRASGERPGSGEVERIADRIMRRPARGTA